MSRLISLGFIYKMQPCLCSSYSSYLDKDIRCSLCCAEQLGTNWTKSRHSSSVSASCTLLMWKAVIMRTSDFSFSLVHGSIALSLYFMAKLVGLKLSSDLSSLFPCFLWGYWILQSLTVCTCAFAALWFTLLILIRGWFVSSQQAEHPVCPDLWAVPSMKIPSRWNL